MKRSLVIFACAAAVFAGAFILRQALRHPQVIRDDWLRREHFVLARSTVGKPEGIETDLFAGLR